MHAVAVPKGVCWFCCPSISNALLPLLWGGVRTSIVGFHHELPARSVLVTD